MSVGNFVQQPGGFKAFIPGDFPPRDKMVISPSLTLLCDQATLALGKLDGIAQLIPDISFFTLMYVRKEAALSSNIEGTKATMHDSLKADIEMTAGIPRDVENIVHYISAITYGQERLKALPLSSRLIKEIHEQLMAGTQEGIGKTPGEYRTTQNWINGTRPGNADFVPPPPSELSRCLSDFEKFLNNPLAHPPLIQAALMHAQFETIHPFLDGNGRTGRLLITLQLCNAKVLEYPILYLSAYFKKHREVYFERLAEYHDKNEITRWVTFFLEGVKEVATQAIAVSKAIVKLRETDLLKIHELGGKQAASAAKLLRGLYTQPIVNVATAMTITGLTRPATSSLVKKFVEIGILAPTDEAAIYGRTYSYDNYLKLFSESFMESE